MMFKLGQFIEYFKSEVLMQKLFRRCGMVTTILDEAA